MIFCVQPFLASSPERFVLQTESLVWVSNRSLLTWEQVLVLSQSNPMVLWQASIPEEHNVPLYLSFFLHLFLLLFGESPSIDICVGRLFTRSIMLPFFLTGVFSLHVLGLCRDTASSIPAAPRLSALCAPAALRRLPKTRAPLCAYSRGLHAPNARHKCSLKEPFYLSPRKRDLFLPEAVLLLSDAGQCDVPAGPACGHSPGLTPQLHKAPGSPTPPKWAAQTVQERLGQGHCPDARCRCFPGSSQHCVLEIKAASTSCVSTSKGRQPKS